MPIIIPGWGGAFDNERIIVYSTPKMTKGAYTVSVQYSADNSTYKLSCVADADGAAYPIIYAEEYQLDKQQNGLSFRLWLNSDIDYLLFRVETDSPAEDIYINEIYIEREFKETLMYLTLRLCLTLLLVDIILCIILNRKVLYSWLKNNTYVVLGLIIIFSICSFGVISDYQVRGHDIEFHWARIVGIAEGLMSGDFPVRIQPGWCNDYGYAASVFYGDILLYFPALLYMAWIPLVYTYKIYLLCINAATIGIAYFCYKRLSHDKNIALVCTALYCISINRILNIFVRAAVGEYSSYMFFPLVLLGAKEILTMDQEEDSSDYGWIFLCIGMTGLIQTHILSLEMACILLGIAAVISIRRVLRREILCAFLKSIIVTICLNLGFLLPFLDYSRLNLEIFKEKGDYSIQGYGLSLYELFSLETASDGGAVLSTKGLRNRYPVSLGLGIIIVIVLALIVLIRCTWSVSEKRHAGFVLGIGCLGLFMSTCRFPWNRLAGIPMVRNIVYSIQFPWRFISVTMPILVYLACLIFLKIKENTSQEKFRYLLAGICLIVAVQGMYSVNLSLRRENYVKYDGTYVLRDADSVENGEYLFENTDKRLTKTDQDISVQNVSVTNTERNGNKMIVSCEAEQDAYLEIPMFAYKYYRCIDMATNEVFPITRGENSKIHIDLPSRYQGDLKIYFAEPWYWRMAEFVSLVTFAGFIICVIQTKKRNRNQTKLIY